MSGIRNLTGICHDLRMKFIYRIKCEANVIEEGILKQLFYRVDVGKIPQSRYRKIKKLSYWKIFFSLLLLTVVALAVL